MFRRLFLILTAFLLVFGAFLYPKSYILNPTQMAYAICSSDIERKTDSELERMLADCEAEIVAEKTRLTNVQKTATDLEAGIAELEYKIKKAELDIKARNIRIARLGDDIVVRVEKITALEAKMARMRSSIAELLRKSNELEELTPVEAVLSGEELSNFFLDLDDFRVVKTNLQLSLSEIKEVHGATEAEKALLEETEAREREERYARQKDKKQTELFKGEKERVLVMTKSQEKAYKVLIAEKEKVKSQIRSRLFRTVGGLELTFGEALDLVRKYETKIQINPALVLAVLTQESSVNGVIGANIGKCTYNQSWQNGSGTVMSDSQKPSFLAIVEDLGLNADNVPVSCPIPSDGSYGGALGPSQFMPNTWWNVGSSVGYKQRVAKVTDDPLPSVFEPAHAFAGTALYLRDALDKCETAFTSVFELRACTAAKYYAGLGASGSRLSRNMNPTSSYGYQVAQRAAKFEKDIETLDR